MEKTRQCRIVVAHNNRLIRLLIGLLLLTTPVARLWAQTAGAPTAGQPVTGSINDEKGSALPGVSVLLKGSSRGTTSNSEGRFQLAVPDARSTLIFSFVGYASQEVAVGNQTNLTVTLAPNNQALNEVVVVGYGTQLKKEVTGSVQTVNARVLEDLPVTTLTQKLQGRLAGVQISQTTGQPGQGMTVRIRGQASISGGNQPLYVVDGFPIVGDLNTINPNEVESITVLKDASSTSLYGSRAANGVVLITTKRAKAGQTTVNVNAYYGIQQVAKKGRPDMMNAREFAQFQKEVAIENKVPVDPVYQNPEQYGEGTNWFDVLLRTAPIQDYSVSLASNKERFSTAAVLGYFNQEGVLLNSGYKRYSLRINSDYQFSNKVRMGVNLAPTYVVTNIPNSDAGWYAGGVVQSAILTSPLAPYKNPDGTLPLTATGPNLFPNPNWYRTVQDIKRSSNSPRLLANAYLEYSPIQRLILKTTINVDMGNTDYSFFSPSTAGAVFVSPPQKATGYYANDRYYSWLSENTATYKQSVGKHTFDGLLGYTVQKFRSENTNVSKTDYPDDKIQTLNAGATTTGSSGDVQAWSLLSYVGRLNYNYNEKYLLSLAIRRDGSSRFGTNNRWGNFPSVSAGWVVSDEAFMANVRPITLLKLRASYGLTGNNNIGNYSYFASVSNTNYAFNGALASGRSVTSLANQNLGWEKTSQFDIGLDLAFLNNRISFTYDYYRKRTNNLLYSIAVPLASGFGNSATNIGEFNFWGHEFTVSSQNLVGALKWNTDLNLSFNDNRVVTLGTTNAPIVGSANITQVGSRIGQFYGYVFDGVYKNQEEFARDPKAPESQVGTVRYKDVNKDGKIDADDRTVIGNPVPTFLFGFTNNFSYRNIDLSIVASGSVGNEIMNRTLEYSQNLDGVFNVTKDVARRWKSEQDPGDGQHPSTKSGTTGFARAVNSRWVSHGDFLTIKNITLGYRVPLAKNVFRSLRVYGSVQQALILTRYNGANPEVNNNYGNSSDALAQGIDFTTYPVPRTYTMGINLGF